MALQADAYSQVCASPKVLFNRRVLALADCSGFANVLEGSSLWFETQRVQTSVSGGWFMGMRVTGKEQPGTVPGQAHLVGFVLASTFEFTDTARGAGDHRARAAATICRDSSRACVTTNRAAWRFNTSAPADRR